MRANDGKWFSADDNAREGNYNWLLWNQVNKEDYDWTKHDFGSSVKLFHDVFTNGNFKHYLHI